MLNLETNRKKYFLFIFSLVLMNSCQNNSIPNNYKEKSIAIVGEYDYSKLYKLIQDSLKEWKQFKVFGSSDTTHSVLTVDSLLCINSGADRLVSCILNKYVNKTTHSVADGISFLYGLKVSDKWYFFTGPYVHVPREMVIDHPVNQPLSNKQLHQIALKEVYDGYLNMQGEINEAWFTSHFENIGFGNFNDQDYSLNFLGTTEKFTDKRKFFEAIHLQGVRNNWYGVKKDSIKTLP